MRSLIRPSRLLTMLSILLVSLITHADPRIQVPEGFVIERLPFDVPNARQMALTDAGALIVGTRRAGKVYYVSGALSATPEVSVIADDLFMPSGVALDSGDLYIGATDRILRISNVDTAVSEDRIKLDVVTDTLPDKRHHGWKYLKFGPDGDLYVPVGAPCNICLSDDPRFASLLRMDPGSGKTEIYAEGIRNTVGFAWHPQTAQLWISDNGRDMMGDDVPPEEINIADQPGLHFGYPFVHGTDIDDPEFGSHAERPDVTRAPALEIQAHSAALGMAFQTSAQWPEKWRNALFIAEHGSWNRSKKVGYQVSAVTRSGDGTLHYQPFATGWLQDQTDWGRPNDVLMTPSGDLLISDDKGGAVYRVRYVNAEKRPIAPGR